MSPCQAGGREGRREGGKEEGEEEEGEKGAGHFFILVLTDNQPLKGSGCSHPCLGGDSGRVGVWSESPLGSSGQQVGWWRVGGKVQATITVVTAIGFTKLGGQAACASHFSYGGLCFHS